MNFLKAVLGDDFELLDRYVPREDEITKFREHVERDRLRKDLPGISDASWDAPLESPVKKRDEPFANPLNFSKSSIGFALRVVRVLDDAQPDANGDRYSHAYNEAGEQVSSRRIKE
jgi:hypothetical protein